MAPCILQPGDIILTQKPTIWAKPIQWITGSQWTHAGIYVGQDRMVHAVWPGGVSLRFMKDIPIWSAWRAVGTTQEDRDYVVFYAKQQIGKKYDLKQFFLLGARIVLGKMSSWTDDPNDDEFVCSELVAEAYQKIGVLFGPYKENILPKDIAESSSTIFLCSNP